MHPRPHARGRPARVLFIALLATLVAGAGAAIYCLGSDRGDPLLIDPDPAADAATRLPPAARVVTAPLARPEPYVADSPRPEDALRAASKTAQSLQHSIVPVDVYLRYDHGEKPTSLAYRASELDELVLSERPLTLTGFVVAADQVITTDPQIDARFLERIVVRFGDRSAEAEPVSWLDREPALVLRLRSPLAGLAPLSFRTRVDPPFRSVNVDERHGAWVTQLEPAMQTILVRADGAAAGRVPAPSLIIDRHGDCAGLSMDGWLAMDGLWQGAPLDRASTSAARRGLEIEATLRQVRASLLRVDIRLRSPKEEDASGQPRRPWDDEDAPVATVYAEVGVVVQDRTVLVLARLNAEATARIESIRVAAVEGEPQAAQYVAGFREIGAFLARTERPVGRPVSLSREPLQHTQLRLLYDAYVELRGERRIEHVSTVRISGFRAGWRGQLTPSVSGSEAHHFLFDRSGSLLALPVLLLADAAEERRWRTEAPALLAAEQLVHMIEDPTEHTDRALVPVAAAKEGQLAWMGVEVQGLNRDLARVNGVSHLTGDGATGARVSYVYPNSPAARLGLHPGDVLLRFLVPGRAKPVDVPGTSEDELSFEERHPEIYSDEEVRRRNWNVPTWTPWPSVQNPLNRALTELGVGTALKVDYAVEGQLRQADITIEMGPPHFASAPRYTAAALGLTVCDLTYEARRHLQADDGTHAVLVSKVEPGSAAGVAGLRRFDLVLEVNERSVGDAAAFGQAITLPGELRLRVRDAVRQRVLKIAAAR